MNGSKNSLVDQSRKDKFFRGEWRQWLDLAANLWDAFSVIGGVVIGIIVISSRDKPTEMIVPVGGIIIGMAVLVMVTFFWIWSTWRSEREKVKNDILSLRNPTSMLVLQILLETPGESWRFKKLQEVTDERGAVITDIRECKELEGLNLIKVVGQLISLTNKSKDHRDWILESLPPTIQKTHEQTGG